jgi:hypothetical protein
MKSWYQTRASDPLPTQIQHKWRDKRCAQVPTHHNRIPLISLRSEKPQQPQGPNMSSSTTTDQKVGGSSPSERAAPFHREIRDSSPRLSPLTRSCTLPARNQHRAAPRTRCNPPAGSTTASRRHRGPPSPARSTSTGTRLDRIPGSPGERPISTPISAQRHTRAWSRRSRSSRPQAAEGGACGGRHG